MTNSSNPGVGLVITCHTCAREDELDARDLAHAIEEATNHQWTIIQHWTFCPDHRPRIDSTNVLDPRARPDERHHIIW